MFHKRLLKEFKENQKYVAGMVLTQWLIMLANVTLVLVTASYIEKITNQQVTIQDTGILLLALVLTLIARGVLMNWNQKMSFLSSTIVKRKLREKIFGKLMKLGANYRDTIATSEAVQISTEGVEQLEIYFGRYVPQFFYSLLAPITLFIIVGNMTLKVAVVLLVCVPLIPISIVAVQKIAKKILKKYWGIYTGLGDSFLECLQGLTTLKIYQADGRYAKKMDEEAEKFRKITMRVLIMQLNSISIMDFIAYGGAVAGIILSVLEYRNGAISIAECFFIIVICAEFFLPLRLLGSFFHIAMNGNAAADKIFALIDVPALEKGNAEELMGGSISFENVTFGYTNEKNVLNHVSLEMPEGGFTALVGASGCGKSTITSLIMGEHRQYSGEIRIGGVESRNIEEQTRYRKITRVRHDSYLLKGTVLDNLCMGNPKATKEDMLHALKQVDLYDTIKEKGGLSMQIVEKAANLSGGQKQRLALARAILHDSDIYIFDEATSNVDAKSENKIMEVIHELAKIKTVILISHRLANVVDADHIIVLEDGIIKECGNHNTLMELKGVYKNLYDSQRELEKYAREAE